LSVSTHLSPTKVSRWYLFIPLRGDDLGGWTVCDPPTFNIAQVDKPRGAR